jgi:site-specific recombinase XerD
MIKEEKVEILMQRCQNYFLEHQYSVETIKNYISSWNGAIIPFMDNNGYTLFSRTVANECNKYIHGKYQSIISARTHQRAVEVLCDMLEEGTVKRRCGTMQPCSLDGSIGNLIKDFLAYLKEIRRKPHTLRSYEILLSNFNDYLLINGIHSISAVNERDLVQFLDTHPVDKERTVGAVRVFFRFLNNKGIISHNFKEFFSGYKIQSREKLPSYYTKEEIAKIESSVNRATALGKRNYAILLLASRLGLRASDIASFSLDNIHWDRNEISLTMYKTGKDITLPLLADVGNAIIDYMRHGRPDVSFRELFIRSKAPILPIDVMTVTTIIASIIVKSEVNINGRKYGAHSMRHSLASIMLKNGCIYPVISGVLGHTSEESTMSYLKIDTDSLSECVLDVPPLSADFYNQKGGVFYA